MLVPLFFLVCALAFLSVLAWGSLSLLRRPGLNRLTFVAFVAGGLIGAMCFGEVYGLIVADGNHELHDRAQVLGQLIGLPVIAFVTGLTAARIVGRRGRPHDENGGVA